MPKYEIYQLGKLPPLTVVEAAEFVIDEKGFLSFYDNIPGIYGEEIAIFNFKNIAGFKKIMEDEPVVHAHWEKGYYEEQGRKTNYFYCSHCLGTHDFKSNYCEDCGAIMDEEAEQK